MTDIDNFHQLLSTINFITAVAGVYYGRILFHSTKGATDFWMFLTAFVTSIGLYTLFDFLRIAIFVPLDAPLRSAQDVAIAFASVFAVLSALYVRKMFDQLFED